MRLKEEGLQINNGRDKNKRLKESSMKHLKVAKSDRLYIALRTKSLFIDLFRSNISYCFGNAYENQNTRQIESKNKLLTLNLDNICFYAKNLMFQQYLLYRITVSHLQNCRTIHYLQL